jgi:1-acyl-sn-glycerol-3-phosphate acyltransferase
MVILEASLTARTGKRLDNLRLGGMCHDVMRVIESCGAKFDVAGLEHVAAAEGPFVFTANHMSSVETLILSALLMPFGALTFVVKESLLSYPVFGPVIRSLRPVAVKRESPRDDLKTVLTEGVERTKAGISVVVFPQATRNPVFDGSTFNSLGVKLASRAGVPVVPVAVKTDFLTIGRIAKDLGRVDPGKTIYVEFGRPITVVGTGRDAHEETVRFIAGRLEQWGGVVRNVEDRGKSKTTSTRGARLPAPGREVNPARSLASGLESS